MFLQIGKKGILNSYQNRCFLIIDSNNEKLIHHILHLGYILSSKQDKTPDFVSSFSMIFTLSSIHLMPQAFFCLGKHICIY